MWESKKHETLEFLIYTLLIIGIFQIKLFCGRMCFCSFKKRSKKSKKKKSWGLTENSFFS